MKTIITQEIDGINIITNTGNVNGLIDPEATKKVVAVEMTKTDVYKDREKIKKQMSVYMRQAREAMKHARKAGTEADKNKFVAEYNGRKLQFEEEVEKIKPLAAIYDDKRKSLFYEHAKYFTPKPGEEILPDAEVESIIEKMVAATQAGKLLDRDSQEVDNYVGKIFWKKISGRWERAEINALGVAPFSGGVEMSGLTVDQVAEVSEQVETDRIDGLPAVSKAAERDNVLAGLLTRSAMMKTELDIMNDSAALSKAQAWLADETAKVDLMYA